jgi:catechol 2,3-dioxygenase-like lactoylglutathione lyase family enzyme
MREISREIYPMPFFVRLEVRDLRASLTWYQEKLGFINLYTLDGPQGPIMGHLRFAKYADVMLVPERSASATKGEGLSLYFTVNKGELDPLAANAGDAVIEGPVNRPWNAREFVARDPDGFMLIFGEGPVDDKKSFDEVMDTARSQSL